MTRNSFIFVAIMSLLLTMPLLAEEAISTSELPSAVLKAFQAAYPNAEIKSAAREEEDGQVVYEIESLDGQQQRDILYTANGTVVEMEEALPFDRLPDAVQKAVKDKYPQAKVEKAEKLTKGNSVQYEVALEASDTDVEVLLDAQGKVVKSKTSEEQEDEDEE